MNHRLIVVLSIIWVLGMDSWLLIGTLAYAATHNITLDAAFVTTISTLAGTVLGYIGGILSSARSPDQQIQTQQTQLHQVSDTTIKSPS